MSMKYYGIYLAYPPNVDLRSEGLGRHLAMFIKGSIALENVKFTIVCPSWTTESLNALFESEMLDPNCVDIVSPKGKPYLLKIFDFLKEKSLLKRERKFFKLLLNFFIKKNSVITEFWLNKLVAVNNIKSLFSMVFLSFAFFVLYLPFIFVFLPIGLFLYLCCKLKNIKINQNRFYVKIFSIFKSPQNSVLILKLFDRMQENEFRRMHFEINKLKSIRAWYCPTVFWPSFNNIKAPKLICVPDVVLSDFSIGFSQIGSDRYYEIFETIGRSIENGKNFVTYSNHVKWHTLVDQYGIDSYLISVIPHAPNRLNQLVDINGFPNNELTSYNFCKSKIISALQRSTNINYAINYSNSDVNFLFYASQARPNKNIINLLRAFKYLLHKTFFGYKLFLTCHPSDLNEINSFIELNGLGNDVIFLPGISLVELAACYKLSQLAINPSLSEGGFPFTFTEALSVGTPVVMGRIDVSEEILTEPQLQDVTFFDPYDWMSIADKIAWALENLDLLLEIQLRTYEQLSQRTWEDVVSEHITAMDEIALSYNTHRNYPVEYKI